MNLICVEDGIDSSKDAGKLMISVLSAVAEIERENIRTQTMAGSEQKAKEGKWNGGFSSGFVKSVLDNPVYMGKIAYGRRRIEKKIGTRNEMHIVEQDEYPIYDGHHEAIISEADWQLAQEKRKANNFKREKLYSTFTEVEQRDFMRAFIERIDIYPEKPDNGCWIRNIVFNFPMPVQGQEIKNLPLESESKVETVCLLSNRKLDTYVHLNLKMEDYYRIKDAEKGQGKK